MLLTFEIPSDYIKGDIVYNISGYPSVLAEYPYLQLKPNSTLVLNKVGDDTFWETLQFINHNFTFWFKLFLTKIFFFLAHVRPYWSLAHNLNSIIILLPLYSMLLVAGVKGKLNNIISKILLIFVLCHVLIVGCSVVDWDGRFLMPIYPVLFLLLSFYWKKPQKLSIH
ncbi:hypothetical protein [Flammeovirga sp. SJP92]|uniref:hypothetical protein n=1 Tax=Flammeovirga sp. SJP92 TaxID=1775430 RepID=UPI0012F87682|nr:hypothetical protein [Flammeovirga sp. SJP92]